MAAFRCLRRALSIPRFSIPMKIPNFDLYPGHETQNQQIHRYRPLKPDEICLLILNPGKEDDAIEYYLKHFSLESAKAYLAFSYAWGDASKIGLTWLDGGQFTNPIEEVYEGANHTVIWLGEPGMYTSTAATFINRMGKMEESGHASYASEHSWVDDDTDAASVYTLHSVINLTVEDMTPGILEGVRDLLARPWLTRIWV